MKTRKVQVTLDEAQYASLQRVAVRNGRKLAAVVREAVKQYCVDPETKRRQLAAIDDLYAMEPVPAPADWTQWKREYSRLKTGHRASDPRPTPDDSEAPGEAPTSRAETMPNR